MTRADVGPSRMGVAAAAAAAVAAVGAGAFALHRLLGADAPYTGPVHERVTSAADLARAHAIVPPALGSAAPLSPDTVPIVALSRKQLLYQGDVVADLPEVEQLARTGLDSRHKRDGDFPLFIGPLARAMAATERDAGPSRLRVLADAATPYRAFVEVAATAGQSRVGELAIVVRTGDALGEIVLPMPTTRAPTSTEQAKALARTAAHGGRSSPDGAGFVSRGSEDALTIHVRDGFSLDTPAGFVDADCEVRPGAEPASLKGRPDDFAALGACVEKLKSTVPAFAANDVATVHAELATDLQTVMATVEAVRFAPRGRPLFPHVALGLPRELPVASAQPVHHGASRDGGAPRGDVSVGKVTMATGMVDAASEVAAGMAAGFRRCYRKGLVEEPTMAGTLHITAKIAATGEVSSASSTGVGLSRFVRDCAAARVSSAQFAAPRGGTATIVIPVTFGLAE